MRYSDDFIIVLPEQDGYRIFEKIINILKTIPNLQLENRKTQFFEMKLPVIMNISKSFADDADSSQKQINFLGFSFDGNKVHLRAKTIGKYYYRMKVQFTRDYTGQRSDGRGSTRQIFHVIFKLSLVAAMVVIIKSTTRRLSSKDTLSHVSR